MRRVVQGVFILVQYLTSYITNGEVFSSTARLTNLYQSTDAVVAALDKYIKREEARFTSLKNIREELIALTQLQGYDDLSVAEHPIAAFDIIHTYYNLYNSMELGSMYKDDFIKALRDNSVSLPTVNDYKGALLALLRLQHIYKLQTSDLITGNVKNRRIAQLSRADAYMIGQQTQDSSGRFEKYRADWLEAALAEEDITESEYEEFPKKSAYLDLAKDYLASFHLDSAMKCINRSRELYPNDVEIASRYHETKQQVDHLKENGVDLESQPPSKASEFEWYRNYSALCRGDASMIQPDVRSSYCTLTASSIPYRPVKKEILSLEPFVVMYHDVLLDSQSIYLREQAVKTLDRATVGAGSAAQVSDARVGQLTWLRDVSPEIQKISQRVRELTGLDVTVRDLLSSAEPFQVVNYGIGGHYEPHLDVYDSAEALKNLPDFLKDTGDRMATFLFYLDDVLEGGATVFPRSGIRVPVVKNSAAFWYNMLRSGETDRRTLHAGCPVLLGQKWVANKWIREYGQEFRHPCGLTPDAPHYA